MTNLIARLAQTYIIKSWRGTTKKYKNRLAPVLESLNYIRFYFVSQGSIFTSVQYLQFYFWQYISGDLIMIMLIKAAHTFSSSQVPNTTILRYALFFQHTYPNCLKYYYKTLYIFIQYFIQFGYKSKGIMFSNLFGIIYCYISSLFPEVLWISMN